MSKYIKVSKGAKIRNRYNQVPHLTQDTKGKVTHLQLDTTNESQEVSPFPVGDHKAAQINRRAQRHNKQKTDKSINDPKKKYRLGTVSKNILLKVSWRQPHYWFRCGSSQIDIWFAWNTPNLSSAASSPRTYNKYTFMLVHRTWKLPVRKIIEGY